MNLVDSHAHLDSPRFAEDRDEVIRRAEAEGVGTILTIGCLTRNEEIETQVLDLVENHQWICAAFGVHPHDAQFYDDALENRLMRLLDHPRVVGLGEIGLDFFYDNSPRDVQKKVFHRQLELAEAKGLPSIIHTRDAEAETIEILADHASGSLPGVLHCFSGSAELARRGIELGMHIGIGGIVTFKKANELREIVKALPADRLLLETDCPYLAPVPHRGKRNEPAFIRQVAQAVAGIRKTALEELAATTGENFFRLFRLAR